jgi:CheY-like chemotaxis protein
MDKKRILFIENDQRLTDSFEECVRDEEKDGRVPFPVEILVARDMAEARDALSRDILPDALLVDLMLPRDKDDLEQLELLEKERRELVKELFHMAGFSAAAGDEKSVDLREKIRQLDDQIRPLVEPEGGREVVETLARRLGPASDPPKPIELPVVFFTARGLPEVKSRCQKLVAKGWFEFIEKPVGEVKVLGTLVDLMTRPLKAGDKT